MPYKTFSDSPSSRYYESAHQNPRNHHFPHSRSHLDRPAYALSSPSLYEPSKFLTNGMQSYSNRTDLTYEDMEEEPCFEYENGWVYLRKRAAYSSPRNRHEERYNLPTKAMWDEPWFQYEERRAQRIAAAVRAAEEEAAAAAAEAGREECVALVKEMLAEIKAYSGATAAMFADYVAAKEAKAAAKEAKAAEEALAAAAAAKDSAAAAEEAETAAKKAEAAAAVKEVAALAAAAEKGAALAAATEEAAALAAAAEEAAELAAKDVPGLAVVDELKFTEIAAKEGTLADLLGQHVHQTELPASDRPKDLRLKDWFALAEAASEEAKEAVHDLEDKVIFKGPGIDKTSDKLLQNLTEETKVISNDFHTMPELDMLPFADAAKDRVCADRGRERPAKRPPEVVEDSNLAMPPSRPLAEASYDRAFADRGRQRPARRPPKVTEVSELDRPPRRPPDLPISLLPTAEVAAAKCRALPRPTIKCRAPICRGTRLPTHPLAAYLAAHLQSHLSATSAHLHLHLQLLPLSLPPCCPLLWQPPSMAFGLPHGSLVPLALDLPLL